MSRESSFRYPGPPTKRLLKEVDQRISDLEWEGSLGNELETLYQKREYLEALLEKGELYVPDF